MIGKPIVNAERSGPRPALSSRLVALLAVLLLLALAIPSFDNMQVGTFIDDANYIVTSRGLATGYGFAQINYTDNRPEDHYPPGFPVLVAPLTAFSGDSFVPLKIFSIVMTALALLLWYRIFQLYVNHFWASTLLILLCTNAVILEFTPLVMSEAIFLCATATMILLTIKADDSRFQSNWFVALLTVLAVACLFIKTAGVPSGVAVGGHLLVRGRRRAAIFIAVVIVAAFGAWTARNLAVTGTPFGPTYGQELSDGVRVAGPTVPLGIIGRVAKNATTYTTDRFQEALVPLRGPSTLRLLDLAHLGWLPPVLSLMISAVILLGLYPRVRRRPTVVEFSFVFYMLGMFVWASTPKRYMHPALPFALLFGVLGAQVLGCWLTARIPKFPLASRNLGLALVALVLLGNVGHIAYLWYAPAYTRYPDISQGATWIADHTPPESIVMTTFPVQRYLYMHRKTVDWPLTSEGGVDALQAYVSEMGARYVLAAPLIDQTTSLLMEPVTREVDEIMRSHLEAFTLIYSDDANNVRVYEVVHRGAASLPPSDAPARSVPPT